ncbi:hypothetical protein [Morganella morganii]|uniref:hypothetical protein n=1 Tax=Morganella morganii TaxID=582 RepID=UPI0021D09388|nr:hypothetical protein [Morganella morganii]MCU6226067.1 hypothetical protein [Morganella morganii]MCU6235228.1 hypothetical protein [Morganella morganii]
MRFKTFILISGLLTTLSGCTSASQKISPQPLQPAAEPVKLLPAPAQNSTSNSCIDDMYLLRKTNAGDYRILSGKYGEVMNEFNFLRENESIMDNDIKIYMRNSLTIKLGKVCSDIKLSAFRSIKKKSSLNAGS